MERIELSSILRIFDTISQVEKADSSVKIGVYCSPFFLTFGNTELEVEYGDLVTLQSFVIESKIFANKKIILEAKNYPEWFKLLENFAAAGIEIIFEMVFTVQFDQIEREYDFDSLEDFYRLCFSIMKLKNKEIK